MSRFNAIYMTGYYAGGALDIIAGGYAWKHFVDWYLSS